MPHCRNVVARRLHPLKADNRVLHALREPLVRATATLPARCQLGHLRRLQARFQLRLPRPTGIDVQFAVALPDAVVGDLTRLRQILTNLIGNAMKFTEQGEVVCRVSQENGDATDQLRITVSDTGIGIPADELDAVFERFQRGSNAPVKTGSGLGLSLVKLLVVGMGGSIEVRSRLNEGSCFTVHLNP